MEPSPQTYEQIGRLSSAWSYLEAVTDQTIWGILHLDDRLGPLITSRLDMRGRWDLILEWAPRKHSAGDVKELRDINIDIRTVNVDRNIIVHGIIHAMVNIPGRKPAPPYTIAGKTGDNIPFVRAPCWTVSRGAEAGKNFPVSTQAVDIVCQNIQSIGERVQEFNKRFSYYKMVTPMPDVEKNWPKPL
jgi:hypothetical protein